MPLPPAESPYNPLKTSTAALATPPDRDPILPLYPTQGYINVFVDDFIGLLQGNEHNSRVRCILLYAIDQVLHTLDLAENKFLQEPVSVKKPAKETAPGPQ